MYHMNNTRQHVLNKLKSLLSSKKAENVEKSIYNYTIQYASTHNIVKGWNDRYFAHVYKLKSCDVMHKMTPSMISQIESKAISSRDIAFQQENQNEDEILQNEIQDGIFQCRKCNSKKTTYYSLQTRSADEPMTNFITCVTCKHRWKM